MFKENKNYPKEYVQVNRIVTGQAKWDPVPLNAVADRARSGAYTGGWAGAAALRSGSSNGGPILSHSLHLKYIKGCPLSAVFSAVWDSLILLFLFTGSTSCPGQASACSSPWRGTPGCGNTPVCSASGGAAPPRVLSALWRGGHQYPPGVQPYPRSV